ncbi:MAG: hypothetical protein WA001_01940 [Patescibacteria group bacterium]
MPSFRSWWSRLASGNRPAHVERYSVQTVTSPAELAVSESLPLEIQYLLAVRPSRFETFRHLLERGYGIGVRTVEQTPERILLAIDRISRETQHNTVIPWLEDLLRTERIPAFSGEDIERAASKGINLDEEAKLILAERFEFRKIVLIDLHNRCVGAEEQRLMHEVNEDLFPLAIDAIVHRAIVDNAHARTEVAQSILKALIIIGPIAHVLEHLLSGLGKLFAASADDLLSEVAELFALRGSGFTWRQLVRRSWLLIIVFVIATAAVFQVDPLIHAGHVAVAGIVFGLSAVALSLTTAVQSMFLYRRSFKQLAQEQKIQLRAGRTLFGLAFRQDFANPARLGLFLGALCAPFAAAATFVLAPQLIHNGWVLALLGSVESVVAGLAVVASGSIERAVFRARMRRALGKLIASVTR